MATVSWVGGSASWGALTNWSGLALPTDIATINQPGSGVYTISEDTTTLINGLTVASANATLAFNTASQILTVNGATALSAGAVNISTTGTLATGTFTQTGGSLIESAGLLSVTGTGTAFSVTGSGSSFNLSGGAVVVANGATLAGLTDTISGGTFKAGTLAVGGTLTTLSGGTLTSSGATTLANGTFRIQSTGTLSTASLAVSGGTFTESGGQVTATGLAICAAQTRYTTYLWIIRTSPRAGGRSSGRGW